MSQAKFKTLGTIPSMTSVCYYGYIIGITNSEVYDTIPDSFISGNNN